ncbi:class I SAM-dependent methyltransferase [Nonomuraea sp. NN258]|nr:class I SAM-dependent methyltransferase [Nonomuraea antri]
MPFVFRGGPDDLFESFAWKVRTDGLLARIRPRAEALHAAECHTEELCVGPWTTPVPAAQSLIGPVPVKAVRRLSKALVNEIIGKDGGPAGRRPYRLDELPAADWAGPLSDERDHVIQAAATLLDRPATGRDVVNLVVAGRAEELRWWHKSQPCPHPTRGVCALLPLLDVALRGNGYTHEHPFTQRVLIGPEGDRVDLVELAGRVERGEVGAAVTERDPDADARRLAGESLAEGDALGWFERLYAESADGDAIVPWDSRAPHALLAEWSANVAGEGRRALVVGSGTGDDAEHVSGLGFDTVAFDVSETAVRLSRERYPGSRVRYQAADLLNPPEEWRRAFDLVVEIMTVQALPEELHQEAIAAVAGFVAPGGTLLVIASGREEGGAAFAPPWPLTRSEIDAFAAAGGLVAERVEELRDGERLRWRAEFRRPRV